MVMVSGKDTYLNFLVFCNPYTLPILFYCKDNKGQV